MQRRPTIPGYKSFHNPSILLTTSKMGKLFGLHITKNNRARLQFEVAQQPRLLAHLPTPLIDLLRLALDSHRYALKVDQDNADLLL